MTRTAADERAAVVAMLEKERKWFMSRHRRALKVGSYDNRYEHKANGLALAISLINRRSDIDRLVKAGEHAKESP